MLIMLAGSGTDHMPPMKNSKKSQITANRIRHFVKSDNFGILLTLLFGGFFCPFNLKFTFSYRCVYCALEA